MKMKFPHIAFGRLVKPLSRHVGVRRMRTGFAPRISFDVTNDFPSRVRPVSRDLMEGLFDGAASFNATRYRCY